MSNSLSASTEGLAIVDKARQRRGWTKTSTARWWQDAHTSRATLRRFWQGDRIQRDIFIAICQAVGISNWEAIANSSNLNFEPIPEKNIPDLDWNEAPDVESFYGRDRQLEQLEQWIITNRCKLIAIVGIAGIGKTALALALADRIQSKFDRSIWRSLQSSPSPISLLDSILNAIAPTVVGDVQQGIAQLLHHLQQRPYLLILDGLEAVLSKKEYAAEYHQLLDKLSRDRHQSCILITSCEQPKSIGIDTKTVRCLNLQGLPKPDAVELLRSRGFTGKELGLSALIQLYRGNPLAIKLVTPLIQSVFGGNIAAFLNQNTLVISERLQTILKQQCEQLSDLEREILYWLAIWQEPVSFCRLQTHFLISVDPAAVLAAIANLDRRSLLEKWFNAEESSFTLQPLVMKIVTDELVERAALEIDRAVQSNDIRHFKILRTHWLVRPGTDDIAGDRILNQLRERLWRVHGATLPESLRQILLLLGDRSPLAIGYIGCNIMALLL
ncbi:NACHT domain-containing protein [Aerosakkonema funiforme]|uniref:NACHT domain-containing protein n=1 Tax=Aerosakkonema funiforme FACHB-1375 TaxID=2949571 RepID=A0A926VGA4_9CYAN|nr:ATP-binding protein [Aerosakkonema funiforme]MBD2183227.1 NACHT domain-containing protein [Aerosakkonema funiforme FACHB-1375]